MPTTTFDNISTVTVSDDTVTSYTFSLATATYSNFIVIGSVAVKSGGTEDALKINVNSTTGSWNQQQLRTGGLANGVGIPSTARSTGLSYAQIQYSSLTSTSLRGGIFRLYINNPASAGSVLGWSEFYSDNTNPTIDFTSFSRISLTPTSLTISGAAGFRIGSVISLYGVIQ